MAFWGVSENTIDSANRLIIPARFREELGVNVGLMKAPEGCLFLYSEAELVRVAEQFEKDSGNPEGRSFSREFFTRMMMVPVDRNYRIVIPSEFMDAAGLKTEVTLIGAVRKIELWDREKYLAEQNSWDDRPLGFGHDVFL